MNQPPNTPRILAATTLLLAAALVLAGCGRRGALDPPPGAVVEAPATAKAGTPGAATKGKTDPGAVPPQKSIVLDKLL